MSINANAKTSHIFFSKNISVYAICNDQNFNDTLTNDIVSFEQLGPKYQLIDIVKTNNMQQIANELAKTTDYWFPLKVHLLSVQQCIQMLDHECLHMFVNLRSVSITRLYCPLRPFGLFSKLVETTSAGGPIDIIIVTKCSVAACDSNCSINSTP